MTIEKAIEILEDYLGNEVIYVTKDERCSMELGIEALRWIRNHRDFLLPGETEEQ